LKSVLDLEFPNYVSMDAELEYTFNPKLSIDLGGDGPPASVEVEATKEIQKHRSGDHDLTGSLKLELFPTLSFVFPPGLPVTLQPFVVWQLDFAYHDAPPEQRRLSGSLANTIHGSGIGRVLTSQRAFQIDSTAPLTTPIERRLAPMTSPETNKSSGLSMTFKAGFRAYANGFEYEVVGDTHDFVLKVLGDVEEAMRDPEIRLLNVLENLLGKQAIDCFRGPIVAGVRAGSALLRNVLPRFDVQLREPWFFYNRTFIDVSLLDLGQLGAPQQLP